MPNSNGLVTPSMPAMATPGSNRSLNAGLPSPASIPQPGSSKIGGSRPSTKMKSNTTQTAPRSILAGTGGVVRTRPAVAVKTSVPLQKDTKQLRAQAIQNYTSRLGSGKAESPSAFLKSLAQIM